MNNRCSNEDSGETQTFQAPEQAIRDLFSLIPSQPDSCLNR